MNLLLLRGEGETYRISRSDRRYSHILRVLRKGVGDCLAAGKPGGSVGSAQIESVGAEGIVLRFRATGEAPQPHPLLVLLGFPRPIQAGRILKDLTSLGLAAVWFCLTELGEKSYAESSFFKDRQFDEHLVEGAEQCGNPRLPEVRTFWSLGRALDALDEAPAVSGAKRLCLHPDPSLPSLSALPDLRPPLVLALGSERGWTEGELASLEGRGFTACGLGDRILKTETAATVAAAIALSRCGLL